MSGRLRIAIALAFGLLFCLIPAPDGARGRADLAVLQVRRWLLQPDGPLRQFVTAGVLPPLQVDVRLSPPDADLQRRCAAEIARAGAEWAMARTAEARTAEARVALDPARPPVPLLVHIGTAGAAAELPLLAAQRPGRAADDRPEDAALRARLRAAGLQLESLLTRDDGGLAATATRGDGLVTVRHYLADAAADPPVATPLRCTVRFPDRGSLVPAFLAIVLAVLWARVVPALLLGCLAGAALTLVGAGTAGWGTAPLQAVPHLLGDTLWQDVLGRLQAWDPAGGFKARIILFVVFLFMAIGVMARAGGIQGMVQLVSRFARGPVRAQLCSWLVGILIFFDDYTNCIVAGTTMQPVTDQNRVSREKLAYIVDSTAAPMAGLSVFSTWIAYEVSQYQAPLTQVTKPDGSPYLAGDAFTVFAQTLPFRFYCIFTLLLVPLTILLGREFGPMLAAERRARLQGKPIADGAQPMVARSMADLKPPDGAPVRAINGLLPMLLLVLVTGVLIYRYGAYGDEGYRVPGSVQGFFDVARWILGNSASEKALMWASLSTLLCAALLALGQRILSLGQIVHAALRSARALVLALTILLLAWCIGQTCDDLGTSYFLSAGFRDLMSAQVLPVLVFLLAGLIAFATGTSFGTMAILLPNVVVLSHAIGTESGMGGSALMVLTIGAVLEGSIFGDHCSPISDTTVLSSLGSRCDHLAHVQTQLPYAVLAMVTATVCGYLPMVFFGPAWWPLAFVAGIAAMAAFLLAAGRRPATAG